MIRRVMISNFRALKAIDVETRPLTVLVGPNDSGKSSFLDAVLLALTRGTFKPEDHWRGADASPRVQLRKDAAPPPNQAAALFQGSVELFKLPADGIPMESSGAAEQEQRGAPFLDQTGANLAAFLDHLLRKDRSRFDQVQASLRQRVPGFEEISIGTPVPAKRSISFLIDGGFEIAGERLSTGVRMLLFFVALAHHPNPPDVVLLEEPENGVHPKRLKDIVALLRGLTTGRPGGKAVQVILTTHSPYLLDNISIPDDQVIVFSREVDGTRAAREADAKRLKTFLDEFMLGEVWFNQGEEGLLTATR